MTNQHVACLAPWASSCVTSQTDLGLNQGSDPLAGRVALIKSLSLGESLVLNL